MSGVLSDLAAVFGRWRIWFLMANQDIALRYRRSLLGPFWISLSMAALITGMALLFGQIFEQDLSTYLIWLGCGFLVWTLFSAMLSEGCLAAIDAETQLRNLPIALPVLAARVVHRNFVIFLHNVLVIAVLLALFGYSPAPTLWVAPAGLALLLMIGFLSALVLAPLCLRFRDITQIVTNALQIAFFLTPIIWMPSQGRVDQRIVESNPFYHLMQIVRAPIIGEYPTETNWTVSLMVLAVLMVLAMVSLQISRRKVFIWL